MKARRVLGLALVAGAGVGAYEIFRSRSGTVAADTADGAPPLVTKPTAIGQSFLEKLMGIESGGDPAAKNPRSSASGAFQFLKSTWQALGGAWGDNPALPFGGLVVPLSEQMAKAAQLTDENAKSLAAYGVAVSDGALYAAHLFGAAVAARVLTAPGDTPLVSLVGQAVISANPFMKTMDANAFRAWLQGKMG